MTEDVTCAIDTEHRGHCVLCTPASHGNRREYTQVPMEIDDNGETLRGNVRVCDQHYHVLARSIKIQNDRYEDTDTEHTPDTEGK